MQSMSPDKKVNWNLQAGTECDFLRPQIVNPGWERGTVKGSNGHMGVLENVIITDLAGNEVHIPVAMAESMIVLLASS